MFVLHVFLFCSRSFLAVFHPFLILAKLLNKTPFQNKKAEMFHLKMGQNKPLWNFPHPRFLKVSPKMDFFANILFAETVSPGLAALDLNGNRAWPRVPSSTRLAFQLLSKPLASSNCWDSQALGRLSATPGLEQRCRQGNT